MTCEAPSNFAEIPVSDSSTTIQVLSEAAKHHKLIKERYTKPAKEMRLSSRFDEAIELLLDGLSQFPDDSHLLCSLGEVYKCKGDMREAMRYFRKTLRVQPRNAVALNSIAHTHHIMGEYEKARRCYTEVLRNCPDDRFALTGVAQAYRVEGYYALARESFRAVLERYPTDEVARILLAKLEMEV